MRYSVLNMDVGANIFIFSRFWPPGKLFVVHLVVITFMQYLQQIMRFIS